jgi:hypothetical protein
MSTCLQDLNGIITLTEQIIVNSTAGILEHVTGKRKLTQAATLRVPDLKASQEIPRIL